MQTARTARASAADPGIDLAEVSEIATRAAVAAGDPNSTGAQLVLTDPRTALAWTGALGDAEDAATPVAFLLVRGTYTVPPRQACAMTRPPAQESPTQPSTTCPPLSGTAIDVVLSADLRTELDHGELLATSRIPDLAESGSEVFDMPIA